MESSNKDKGSLDSRMTHQEIIKEITQSLLVTGKRPSQKAISHIQNCRSCFDSLVAIASLVEPGISDAWYKEINNSFPCDQIESELDLLVAMDESAFASEKAEIAFHLEQCGLCSERFNAAKLLLEAEAEGIFGPPIDLPHPELGSWMKIKDKVFEFSKKIEAILTDDYSGFKELTGIPGLVPQITSGAIRSPAAKPNVVQEACIEMTPPTCSDNISIRLINEAEEQLSIEVEITSNPTERLVIALFESDRNSQLLEARSISESQRIVRFERLPQNDYFLEIRSSSGTSKIPLKIRQE